MENKASKIVIILAMMCLPIISFSQSDCRVRDDFESDFESITQSEYMAFPWYNNENFLDYFYDSLSNVYGGSSLRAEYGAWLRIPIQFWVYRNNNGTRGGVNDLPLERDFQTAMDDLNEAFRSNNIKLQFYINGITFVNNTNGINPTVAQQLAMAVNPATRNSHMINVHVNDAERLNEYWTVSDVIFIRRNILLDAVNAKTLTHEVGHFFGLLHTHNFNNTLCLKEPVSRGFKLSVCPPIFFGCKFFFLLTRVFEVTLMMGLNDTSFSL